jgi:hypothetical protein
MAIVAQFASRRTGHMRWFFAGPGGWTRAARSAGGGSKPWAIWAAATILSAGFAFAAGEGAAFRPFPEIVATLPGDESEFSREFDDRLRQRFPIGSSEDKLLAFLASENFLPDWRRRDGLNASFFVQNGLICERVARVFWRADAGGALTQVRGSYESQCL